MQQAHFKHQLLQTGLLTLLLVVGVAGYRPPSQNTGIPEYSFWNMKLHWGPEFDRVIAGDSRVSHALSPRMMDEMLGSSKTANFGFTSLGYSKEYLEHVRSLLKPSSLKKEILLGISPWSLTPLSTTISGYYEAQKLKHPSNAYYLTVDRIKSSVLRPFTLSDTQRLVGKNTITGYMSVNHASGWTESDFIPPDPTASVAHYIRNFKGGNQVSSQMVEQLLLYVAQWKKEGITVYGFSTPLHPSVLEVEDKYSGFNRIAFRQAFENHGGIWLTPKPQPYLLYDGVHMASSSAQKYTQAVALSLKQDSAQLPPSRSSQGL